MAALTRLTTNSLYALSAHRLHSRIPPCLPVSSLKFGCKTCHPCAVRLDFHPTLPSSGFGLPQKNVRRRIAKRLLSPSKSGRSVDPVSSTSVALRSRVEPISKTAHGRPDSAELVTPLCERPASSTASLIDVYRWRNEAQELAISVGSEYLDADGGPEVSDLLRELEWLLDDVVAACGLCLDKLKIHSSTWKACAWRDIKDVQISGLEMDNSMITDRPREDSAAFAVDVPAIYGAFGALCRERHTDPVNEFAADCGCSCDGIRESLAEMALSDEHLSDIEARMSSLSVLVSGINKLEDYSDGHPNPSLPQTTGLQLLLRMSIKELEKAWRERIKRRRPFQYVVAAAHWRDLILGVVEGVLIPRPETEQIVDLVEAAIIRDKSLGHGLWADLGTGSGAIAIAVARFLQPPGSVVAIDASSAAVAVARRNVDRYCLQNKVKVQQGFWFSPLQDEPGKLAGVVSNPPYIPSENLSALQAEVGKHEPRIALDGGPDGMNNLREICGGSASALQSGGFLALETNGEVQADIICNLLSSIRVSENSGIPLLCFRDVKQVKDFAGLTRFVTATRC